MTTELTSKSQRTSQPAILSLVDNDPYFRHVQDVYNAIARRAYDLFQSRGRGDGHDIEDWLFAESEMLNPVPVEISEADRELIVNADLPGFRDKDIELRVEPRRLVISGKREEVYDRTKRKTIYSEMRSREVFRVVDLPQKVDPENVKATLHDGRLEIDLPKAEPAKKIPITAKAA